VKKRKPRECLGNDPTKPVGVDVEQSNFCQQTQLDRNVPGNVSVVKINASHNSERRVVKSPRAENTIVSTNVETNPIPRDVKRVRVDCLLPCLERNVCTSKPGIGKSYIQNHLKFVLIG
jgi:hypothetical protein